MTALRGRDTVPEAGLGEDERAVIFLRTLIDAHAGPMVETLRERVAEQPREAHRIVTRYLGYVPRDPVAAARWRLSQDRYPTGMPGRG